jgi:Ca2+:H+ antiporter
LIAHTILTLIADRYRRKAHNAAWYDSPNECSNLPFALKNPFGKRNPRGSIRTNNDQHLQETGVVGLKGLKPIKTDRQDYRSTTSFERRRELGLDEQKQHSATMPNVTSAHDFEQILERKGPDSTRRVGGALAKMKSWRKPKDTSGEIDDPDAKKEKRVYTPMSQVRATILNSWINVLLIACW